MGRKAEADKRSSSRWEGERKVQPRSRAEEGLSSREELEAEPNFEWDLPQGGQRPASGPSSGARSQGHPSRERQKALQDSRQR
jgi:hypothetical protein